MSENDSSSVHFFKFQELIMKPLDLVAGVLEDGKRFKVSFVADITIKRDQFNNLTFAQQCAILLFQRERIVAVVEEALQLLPIRDELSPGWRPLVDDVVLSRFLGFDDVHWVSVVVANGRVYSNIIQAFGDFFSHIFHNLRNGLLVKRLKVVRNGVTTPKGNIGLDVILDVREQAFEYELVGIAVVVTPLASGSLLSRRLTAICPAAEWLATIVVSSLSVRIIEMEVAKNDYLEELPSGLAEFWSILLVKLVHKVVIPELFGLLAEEIVDPVVHVNLLPVLHVANVENESAHALFVKDFFR